MHCTRCIAHGACLEHVVHKLRRGWSPGERWASAGVGSCSTLSFARGEVWSARAGTHPQTALRTSSACAARLPLPMLQPTMWSGCSRFGPAMWSAASLVRGDAAAACACTCCRRAAACGCARHGVLLSSRSPTLAACSAGREAAGSKASWLYPTSTLPPPTISLRSRPQPPSCCSAHLRLPGRERSGVHCQPLGSGLLLCRSAGVGVA